MLKINCFNEKIDKIQEYNSLGIKLLVLKISTFAKNLIR